MKRAFIITASLLSLIFSLNSCNKTTSGVMMEALATCKETSSGAFYLQIDDKTILEPNNIQGNPYGEQTRAFVAYIDYGQSTVTEGITVRKGDITGISKVLTKDAVASEGAAIDPVKYGNDPMDIVNNYATVVEDGYISIAFRSLWGVSGTTHTFNLVKNVDATDPYLFELRQNYNGDNPTGGLYLFGNVAFNISDIISDKDKTYNISVRHYGTDGQLKTAKFTYKYGTSAFIDTSNEVSVESNGSYSEVSGSIN